MLVSSRLSDVPEIQEIPVDTFEKPLLRELAPRNRSIMIDSTTDISKKKVTLTVTLNGRFIVPANVEQYCSFNMHGILSHKLVHPDEGKPFGYAFPGDFDRECMDFIERTWQILHSFDYWTSVATYEPVLYVEGKIEFTFGAGLLSDLEIDAALTLITGLASRIFGTSDVSHTLPTS